MEFRIGCGYSGHACNFSDPNSVKFISRYHQSNDYCVGGHRVGLSDSGEWRDASEQQKQAVRWFLLTEYVNYLSWHRQARTTIPCWPEEAQPFDHATAFVA